MSMFRKNRLTDEQLRELLQGLPQAKASADFESNLDRLIASHSHHVPNLLGSLPLVPAPEDFDARLKEAINDRRRPVAPIPVTVAAGGASINWINHIMGWIGGSLAVVALAFFINHAGEIAPEASKTPAPSPAAATESVAPAAPAIIVPKGAKAAPVTKPMSVVVDQPVVEPAPAPVRVQQPAARPRRTLVAAPRVGESATRSVENTSADQREVRTSTMESASTTNTGDSATGPTTSTESEIDAIEKDGGNGIPNTVVNTGGDTGGDSSNPE